MERLDIFLFLSGKAKSREQAKSLISEGNVTVNGAKITKPAFKVSENDEISVLFSPKYVGRGGLKLEKALNVFGISAENKICLDVGASTGGFTDCMLQNGAKKVYALDVGHGQLDEKLKNDPRVINLEGTHIKDLSEKILDGKTPELVSVDVSFISLEKVLPYTVPFMSEKTDLVCLFKPQFEVGKTNKGIVRREKEMVSALKKFILFLPGVGLCVKGLDFSPIKGGDGNTEFLLYLKHGGDSSPFDIEKTVAEAVAGR